MKHNFRIKKYKCLKHEHRHVKCLDTKYKRLADQYREFYENSRHNFNIFTNIAKNEVEIAYETTGRMFKTLISVLTMIGIINLIFIFIK